MAKKQPTTKTQATKEKEFSIKKLCKLPSGRTVYTGDVVKDRGVEKEVTGLRNEDGDKYLTFTDGTEALAVAGSDFWNGREAYIHVK